MTPDRGNTVEVEHRVGRPPESVFPYFTDAAMYSRWKGQDAELDPRPGGIYRVAMAPGVWVSGEYVVVDPPHRIVLTWGWDATFELPRSLAAVPPGSSRVEFTFDRDGEGTIIRVRHSGLPGEDAMWAHDLGWRAYIPRVTALLDGLPLPDDPAGTLAEAYIARDTAGALPASDE